MISSLSFANVLPVLENSSPNSFEPSVGLARFYSKTLLVRRTAHNRSCFFGDGAEQFVHSFGNATVSFGERLKGVKCTMQACLGQRKVALPCCFVRFFVHRKQGPHQWRLTNFLESDLCHASSHLSSSWAPPPAPLDHHSNWQPPPQKCPLSQLVSCELNRKGLDRS